ncbi:MAG: leucine-rich repeat domain-containing protein [Candidatus Azobacteroides sp.]|nr:leucine-rich repeat domain-containing protein [Candidatus Azobacteroides sp.]
MKIVSLHSMLCWLMAALSGVAGYATNVIHVPAAGQLGSVLTQVQKDTITTLKLTGSLDSQYSWGGETDFNVLRTMPMLQYLDLSEVNIENNLIPYGAFQEKESLKSIILPATLTLIESQAFYRCRGLEKVTTPEGLELIQSRAFDECVNLKSINFPSSLTSIESAAFNSCSSLAEIILPDGLQRIGSNAFSRYDQLSELQILPASVTEIGSEAFAYCSRITSFKIKAIRPPVTQQSFLGDVKTVYVPASSAEEYRSADYWKEKIIIDGDTPTSITLHITTPGTLGEKVLEQFAFLRDVNVLIVSGTLNDTDFNYIKNDMTSLIKVDMSECMNEELPENLFYNRPGLLEVKFPAGLKKIGTYCFWSCHALTTPEFPATLLEITRSAFENCNNIITPDLPDLLEIIERDGFKSCVNMISVHFPATLTKLGEAAFYNCSSLKEIIFPEDLTIIGPSAFAECKSLRFIQLPARLRSLQNSAFYGCTNLEEIILPAGLKELSGAFNYCSGLKKVTCLQATPPILEYDAFNGISPACELIVPVWAESMYKLADYWKNFQIYSTHNLPVDYLPVFGNLTLKDSILPTGTPETVLFPEGSISVGENTVFNMSKYTQRHQLTSRPYYYNDEDGYYTLRELNSSLISETSLLRADSVIITITASPDEWHYFSVPFDAQVSDIEVSGDVLYAIRRYNGATRAGNGAGDSWENITENDILYANQGYIIQFNKMVKEFRIKAINNENKNKLFSDNIIKVNLQEYPSEFTHNRSWNFTGNPFPCYFDIAGMEYTAPITVWENNNYLALSLTDDKYILRPMQAFFVQKPVGTEEIIYHPDGRQTVGNPSTRNAGISGNLTLRTIYNLTVKNNRYSDKTRIVINPEAKMEYEIDKDASKFISPDNKVPLLFTMDKEQTRYAINERPLEDGIVALGFYAGETGDYTFSLSVQGAGNSTVWLIDKLKEKKIDLSSSEYTFSSKAGSFPERFELRISQAETNMENTIQQPVIVKAEASGIIIEAERGSDITVISASGIIVNKLCSQQSITRLEALPGIYIVIVNGNSHKIVLF